MQLNPIYIPFESIFPNLVGFLSSREDFSHHFPRINQNTPYGQSHKVASALERNVKQLHLIMHRIRTDSGVMILPGEKYQTDFLYLPVDCESFFVWLRKTMDQVAYLTAFFYERQGIMPRDSFHDQYEWLINKRPDFDTQYSAYLQKEMEWFASIRDIRDDALHRHYWSYVEMRNWDDITLRRMRGNRLEQEVLSISKEIGSFYLNLTEFSRFYEEHFRTLLEDRGKTDYRKLNASMVVKYTASINYFIDKARQS